MPTDQVDPAHGEGREAILIEEEEWNGYYEEDLHAEFMQHCDKIAEIPEGTTWDQIAEVMNQEMGADAPTHEEFIATSWACGAVDAGHAIYDLQELCHHFAEELPEDATFEAIAELANEAFGVDAPTEE